MSIPRSKPYYNLHPTGPLVLREPNPGVGELEIHGSLLSHADPLPLGLCTVSLDELDIAHFGELNMVARFACPHAIRAAADAASQAPDAYATLQLTDSTPNGLIATGTLLRRSNSPISELTLWNNRIDDTQAAALAETLEGNTILTSLNLSENLISNEGIAALAYALAHNSTLTTLDLSFNPFGEEGVSLLSGLLDRNFALTTLKVEDYEEAKPYRYKRVPFLATKEDPALAPKLERNRQNTVRHRSLFSLIYKKMNAVLPPFKKLNGKTVAQLSEIVKKTPYLTTLNLDQVINITAKGRNALLQLLDEHPFIESLGPIVDQRRTFAKILAPRQSSPSNS